MADGGTTKTETSTAADERTTIVRRDLDNVLHPAVAHRQLEAEPLVIVEGHGSTVVDADGTEYLDGMAGLWCVNIGYGRTELAEVASQQMQKLSYYPHTAMNAPAAALAEKVNGLLGGDNHVYLVSSGSEANEAAIKFARQYAVHESPGQPRYKSISRYYGYHGTTLATLAAGGMGDRKMKFEPLSGNAFVHVAPPYCYRCPFGLVPDSCGLACVKNMETTIQGEGPETVAMFIAEPVIGTSSPGVAPPNEYYARVREICDRHDVLFVADETICAFGRIGDMFAMSRYGVTPDIITCAKGITSGYSPLGAMIVGEHVFEPFRQGQNYFPHGYTFGGHPVSCAVALANLDVFEREGINQHVRDNEGAFRATLERLGDLPIVGDVRGDGYFYGIELVKDKVTKETFDDDEAERLLRGFLSKALFDAGLYCRADDRGDPVVQLAPPLIVGQSEFDFIEQVLRSVLTEAWSIL
jgi:adenosylmethionine-8-amino-7-oxononanoate aminotransferase